MLVVFALLLGVCSGWWQEGHYVVAAIASSQMTAAERANMNAAVVGDGQLFGFAPNLIECAAYDAKEVFGILF